MKIIWINGGLGNQMFQYAFLKSLQQRSPGEKILGETLDPATIHNGYELDRVFGIQLEMCNEKQLNQLARHGNNLWSKISRKLFGPKITEIIETEEEKFTQKKLALEGDGYFYGYWQSPLYFDHLKPVLVQDFAFNLIQTKENEEIAAKIKNKNSVGIHVRRGDYVTHPNFGGICDLDYYEKAIAHMKTLVPGEIHYFIFSDDCNWCRENLDLDQAEYIDWNKGNDSYMDMYLMSQCKHNIIANSSFSWWGAYLNEYPDRKIIAPARWKNNMTGTRDLIPANWIQVQ